MRLLAIDTSTLSASVAVAHGDRLLAVREGGVQSHSRDLLAHIEGALGEAGLTIAELDGIAVGGGPGSFTGLRIGFATAKGLCFAASKPLYTVSSLAALALDLAEGAGAAAEDRLLVPVLDAKRQEIFAGFFRADPAGGIEPLAPEQVMTPGELATAVEDARERASIRSEPLLGGDGAVAYRDQIAPIGSLLAGARPTPSAAAIARLAVRSEPVENLASATPAYIRPSEAEVKFPQGNPGGPFSGRR